MNEIKELFYEYLNPNNLNPEESGNALFEQFCSSIDVLFEIILNEPKLSSHGVIFLKRVLDVTLNDMSDEERQELFEFITSELIPNILPQNPHYLSPNIYEIFSITAQSIETDVDSLNEYIKNLTDPIFLPFVVIYLFNLEPSYLDLEFTCNIMSIALETTDADLIKLCVRLFVVLCNNFPSSPVFQEFCDKFIEISVDMQSPDVWNTLSDLSEDFAQPFMEPASTIFSNDASDFKERISAFNFYVDYIDGSNIKELSDLLEFLVEFQISILNECNGIDPSLFYLYRQTLENPEISSEAFETIKNCTFELLESGSDEHMVVGLYSLEFLIDNSQDLSLLECIPNDLSIFHQFLTSEDYRQIEATFEVLKVLNGKPIGSHFNFEPIFQDVIELFINEDDNIRNRAAIFSYRYMKKHLKYYFSFSYWIFEKFIEILHMVKNSELSIYLDILADSILPNIIEVSDADIDNLVEAAVEILNSNRDLEIKVSAASLCCSLIKKDADLAFQIADTAVNNAFMALTTPNAMMRKTMAKCLNRFIKFTRGVWVNQLRELYPKLLNCSISNGMLSPNHEPILLAGMIKWDPELPDKDEFLSLLLSIIYKPPNEKQYKIATKCLRKVITNLPLTDQVELTNHICKNIFMPEYVKLNRLNVLLLSSMLKDKNPEENRIQIAQIISTALHPFSDNILKVNIGSISILMRFIIKSVGSDLPENIKEIRDQLFERTMDSPELYTHFNYLIYFMISDCIKYSTVEQEMFDCIIDSSFTHLNEEFTNLDACCYLLCIKAGIEKDIEILNDERMDILTNCWEIMSNDSSMIMSKFYLAHILILLGCQDAISPELFIDAIQTFPMEVKDITGDVCQLFLSNFQDLNDKDNNVMREIVYAIIRLLKAGKSIRYTHNLEIEVVIDIIGLGLMLASAIELDIEEAIQTCLPDSPRIQEIVSEFFQNIASS